MDGTTADGDEDALYSGMARGVHVRILKTDHVEQRAPECVGMTGVIQDVPTHPNTWFKVKVDDDGRVLTVRHSALELVSDEDDGADGGGADGAAGDGDGSEDGEGLGGGSGSTAAGGAAAGAGAGAEEPAASAAGAAAALAVPAADAAAPAGNKRRRVGKAKKKSKSKTKGGGPGAGSSGAELVLAPSPVEFLVKGARVEILQTNNTLSRVADLIGLE